MIEHEFLLWSLDRYTSTTQLNSVNVNSKPRDGCCQLTENQVRPGVSN